MNTGDENFNRFLVIWSGQLISSIGSGLTAFALGVFIFEKTQSAVGFSLIILFSFLPSIILLPFGGVMADKFDRKKMMLFGDAGAITGLLFILLIILSGSMKLWHLYIGTALSSAFAAIRNPSYKATVTDLVSKGLYSRASGLIQLAGSAQYLISPVMAGFLMSIYDIKLVLSIDIMTFVIAFVAVFMIKRQDAVSHKYERTNFFPAMVESFGYIKSHPGVFRLVLLTAIVCFFVGLFQSLFGPMILTLADSNTLGMALSLSASGMLISSLFIGTFGIGESRALTLSLFLTLAGLFYSLIGIFTAVVLITAFGFLFFSTLPFVNTSLEVLIRSNVDNERQGRIWSMVAVLSQAGYVLAFGSAGFLADYLFEPLFVPEGVLAQTAGQVIGTGPGRGIGFLFILSGLFVSIIAIIMGREKRIIALEPQVKGQA